eukprot:CAMPEP_0198137592 /NCGR_PEP_ID=MMETSP1443-20131203/1061_1 /TAXON_ID=186043 /ORGANISM="Entomoneis sp., Strain CCMP2396" /LENGTH=277 /DNA_ID=CAMNT_0043799075 /DNA_START=93 /DNA_END=926 /DNA_ORIENTATION=+
MKFSISLFAVIFPQVVVSFQAPNPVSSFLNKKNVLSLAAAASGFDAPKRSLVIWDCDGVLVDSEALLKKGEVESLAEYGIEVTVEDCVRMFSGVSPDKAIENFKAETGQEIPIDFFPKQIAGSMDLFRAQLQPLMLETVSGLAKIGATQCIASGSPRDRVELCVDVAGMRPYFSSEVVYTREMVNKGKPAPDLFLHAAEQMGFAPEDCIVIEDASSGVKAAQAAGMEVLGFLGGGHATADWYQKAMYEFGIPIVHKEKDVYDYIASRTVFIDQMAPN